MAFWPFETAEEAYRRYEKKHRSAERKNWRTQNRISRVTALLALIAAGAAVVGAVYATKGYGQLVNQTVQAGTQARAAQDQLGVMLRDQRGWIAPKDFTVSYIDESGSETPFPTRLAIHYQNIGRTPAFRTAAMIDIVRIGNGDRVVDISEANRLNTAASQEEECSTTRAHDGYDPQRTVIWPSIDKPSFYNIRQADSAESIFFLRKGTSILRVNGCFNYETGGEPHQSWFCMILRPDFDADITKWTSINCKDGNDAN